MKKEVKKEIRRYFFMVVACVLYAFALECFLVPSSIVAGGISGLATVIHKFINLEVGVIIILCNIPILIISVKSQGIKFTLNCLITTLVLGTATTLMSKFDQIVKDERMLNAVFGGLIQGAAIGLFCKYRVSSGGTELVGRFLHNLFRGISIPVFTAILDSIIVITGAIVMKDVSNLFYALIVIFISSKISDMILVGLNNSKLCYIITDYPDKIGDFLISHSPRGVTKIDGIGMYTKTQKGVLMTVVKNNQIQELKEFVTVLDSNAFVIVSNTTEVLGNGFKTINEDEELSLKKEKLKKEFETEEQMQAK